MKPRIAGRSKAPNALSRHDSFSTVRAEGEDVLLDVMDTEHPCVSTNLHRVPFFALVYVLFVKTPSPTGLQLSLNAIGLLSALSLTIVGVMPFTRSHADYEEAIQRWNDTTLIDGDTLYPPGDPRRASLPYADPYLLYHQRWGQAFAFLTVSLILAVVLTTSLSHASFRNARTYELDPKALFRFWMWVRPIYTYCVFSLVWGIIMTCLATNNMLRLFLPATPPFRARNGLWDLVQDHREENDAAYSLNLALIVVMICPLFVSLLLISCGFQQSYERARGGPGVSPTPTSPPKMDLEAARYAPAGAGPETKIEDLDAIPGQ